MTAPSRRWARTLPPGATPARPALNRLATLVCSTALAGSSTMACAPRPNYHHPDARAELSPPPEALAPALVDASIEEGETAFDFRLLEVAPQSHVGQWRICEVGLAGALQVCPARLAHRYPISVGFRRLVRCDASNHGTWIDLVFGKDADTLARLVRRGQRLRVEPLVAAGGAEGAPIVAFIATIDSVELPPPNQGAAGATGAGDDVGDPSAIGWIPGSGRVCVVSHVGRANSLGASEEGPGTYPADVSARVDLACRHARGDAWVDLVFDDRQRERVLTVDRGARLPLELVAPSGGHGDHPIVRVQR